MNNYHIFFTKLANPLKIGIITELKRKEQGVSELSKGLNVEQSKLSHALSSLKFCKIVHDKKKGKEKIYSLNKETILPILKIIDEHEKKFCKCCCRRKNEKGLS